MRLITSPIGINVLVVNSIAPRVQKKTVPFFPSDLVRIAIIIAIPASTTWLPGVQ